MPNWPSVSRPARGPSGQTRPATCPARWRNSSAQCGTAHVEAAATELGLLEDWIGKGNRETQTLPVLHLRETATKMGLLRKHRGMLLLTAVGRKLRTDPVSLWWHLAERMPPKSADRCETQAGLSWLLAVAAQRAGDPAGLTARILTGIGWTLNGREALTASDAD